MSEVSNNIYKPTLYYYEHCPYCVRVLLFAAMANIELKHHVLLNDDEATPISMVGSKMVPILEYTPQKFMAESLDIIYYLSECSGINVIKSFQLVEQVGAFIAEAKLLVHKLTMPRWAKISFKEFDTQSAIDYFTHKKIQIIGDFDEAELQTSRLIDSLLVFFENHQSLFNALLKKPINTDASIILFSSLNGLYCVKNFPWPEVVSQFMSRIKQESGIKIPDHLAI